MARTVLTDLIIRMSTDPAFAKSIRTDAQALAGYDLTPEQIQQLQALGTDEGSGLAALGERRSKSSLFFMGHAAPIHEPAGHDTLTVPAPHAPLDHGPALPEHVSTVSAHVQPADGQHAPAGQTGGGPIAAGGDAPPTAPESSGDQADPSAPSEVGSTGDENSGDGGGTDAPHPATLLPSGHQSPAPEHLSPAPAQVPPVPVHVAPAPVHIPGPAHVPADGQHTSAGQTSGAPISAGGGTDAPHPATVVPSGHQSPAPEHVPPAHAAPPPVQVPVPDHIGASSGEEHPMPPVVSSPVGGAAYGPVAGSGEVQASVANAVGQQDLADTDLDSSAQVPGETFASQPDAGTVATAPAGSDSATISSGGQDVPFNAAVIGERNDQLLGAAPDDGSPGSEGTWTPSGDGGWSHTSADGSMTQTFDSAGNPTGASINVDGQDVSLGVYAAAGHTDQALGGSDQVEGTFVENPDGSMTYTGDATTQTFDAAGHQTSVEITGPDGGAGVGSGPPVDEGGTPDASGNASAADGGSGEAGGGYGDGGGVDGGYGDTGGGDSSGDPGTTSDSSTGGDAGGGDYAGEGGGGDGGGGSGGAGGLHLHPGFGRGISSAQED